MRLCSFVTLLHHQLRLTAQNRTTPLILALFVLVGILVGRRQPEDRATCYVLYWEDHPWVERLKAEIPSEGTGPPIEVAPVGQFIDDRGTIIYPSGSHSIQLRPPNATRPYWLIWYWYSGSDPSVLQEPAEWFWDVTRRHFGHQVPMAVRSSSLEPAIPLTQTVRWSLAWLRKDFPVISMIAWAALFFCAAYLPAVSLAQQREQGLIASLVVTPAGWRGVERSIWLFHAGLACAVTAAILFAGDPSAASRFWVAVPLAAIGYLGVGFTFGSRCKSVVSAACGLMLYVALSGMGAALIHPASAWAALVCCFSIEANILHAFRPVADDVAAGNGTLIISQLAICALVWLAFGHRSFRGLEGH